MGISLFVSDETLLTETDSSTAGPVCGGFLSQAAGWRWIFWVLAIAIGIVSIAAAPIIRETYAPVLLERKTARLRKETGNPNLRSKLQQNLTPKEVFVRAIARPTKLLFLSPICGLMSLYMGMESTAHLPKPEFILTNFQSCCVRNSISSVHDLHLRLPAIIRL
jgi:MFS family permease